MHSCPIATGDAFLSTFVPRITSSPAFADSVLFITTDEGKSDSGGGGQVVTVVISPLGKTGFTSALRATTTTRCCTRSRIRGACRV
jgi:hypothetical protein